jgi:glycosyltransferase involved in cell wall biosynthesis
LARARTLAASLARHAPAVGLVALVLDATGDDAAGGEPFELLTPQALAIEDFALLAAEFDEQGLREACQPLLLAHLLARGGQEAVLYVAADSLVLGPLEDVERAAAEHGVLLWALTGEPLPLDGRRPNEADLREWGLYDSGLVAFAGGRDHSETLDWWAQRARAPKTAEHGSPPLERVATLGAHVIRTPGLGTSFWNLPGRELASSGEQLTLDGEPLRLLRLSGFDPATPELLSAYQDRLRLQDLPPLRRVCEDYAAELAANGDEALQELEYRWETLPDGTRLDHRLRTIWARARESAGLRRSPFTPEGMAEFYAWLAAAPTPDAAPGINRLCALICELQPEIGAAYPDLSDPVLAQGLIDWLGAVGAQVGTLPASLLPPLSSAHDQGVRVQRARERAFGVNVAGYFSSELGVGEAARLIVAALDSVEVPLLPVRVPDAPPSRQGHPYTTVEAGAARFPFNLICVNGDGLPDFRRAVGPGFLDGRYNIGMWWWEVGRVPAAVAASFEYLDELWVGSEHVARAFAAESPVPVYTITQPVIRPDVEPLDLASVGLGGGDFTFLFMFDYHSVFERKNPLAIVDAFARAYAPGSGATLVIKAINGEHDPANRERLRRAAAGHPDVHLLEGYFSTRDNLALIAACDCYVSLHRSEGFALTPAEAMALGKPVIATGYSGNLEYMTPTNAYLVDYEMTAVGPGNAPYPPDAQWAAPNVEHAAALMREVSEDLAGSRARGARAAADIAKTHSPLAAGQSMKRRLDALRSRVELPERELPARAQAVAPTPVIGSGGGLRGSVRRAIGRRVRRSIEEDLVALRESIHALHTAIAGIELVAVEAANDAARTQAAALAALRQPEPARTAAPSVAAVGEDLDVERGPDGPPAPVVQLEPRKQTAIGD